MRPEDESELAEVVRGASAPVRIRGGGTREVGRPISGAVVETGAISGITLYEPAALTLVARAGTPLAEVVEALAAEGQRLPFEPPDWRALLGTSGESTIGGVVAANASGPRRIMSGACRDSLIGVRFVDGTGAVIKNGGRVMKNVTGYDLVKLLAGSWGTLGVLTEVSFKVLPVPESAATLLLPGIGVAPAVAALAAAIGSPFEVSGAAWTEEGAQIRIEGFAASVAYRAERLQALLAPFGEVVVEAGRHASDTRWAGLRDVAGLAGRPGDIWRVSVKPSDAPALVARMGAEAVALDWAGGLVWALTEPGTDLRARLGAFAGHATLMRAAPETRARIAPFQPEAPAIAAIATALRARFDPRHILNPGLMD